MKINFKLTRQSVWSDEELGKRIRQAACDITWENATSKFMFGDEPPVPVAPHPEIRPCWFSNVEVTWRRFGSLTIWANWLKIMGRTSLTREMSLSLIVGLFFDKRLKRFFDKISERFSFKLTHVEIWMNKFMSSVNKFTDHISVYMADFYDGIRVSVKLKLNFTWTQLNFLHLLTLGNTEQQWEQN